MMPVMFRVGDFTFYFSGCQSSAGEDFHVTGPGVPKYTRVTLQTIEDARAYVQSLGAEAPSN